MISKAVILSFVLGGAIVASTMLLVSKQFPKTEDFSCAKTECNITVLVSDDLQVSVDKPRLKLDKTKQPVKIHWKIDPDLKKEWRFSDEKTGIVFKNNGANQLTGNAIEDSGTNKKFKWDDKNTDQIDYTYKITVTNSDGTITLSSPDPIIANGN